MTSGQLSASKTEIIDRHYDNLAGNYDLFLKYSPDFIRRLTRKMIEKLQLREDDRLVDLGGGTGIYALDILEQVPLRQPVLLVDYSGAMLARAPADQRLEPLEMGGFEFACREGRHDKILIKETVHHIADRARLLAELYERLSPGGRLLLVHIPPRIDYPLFRAAIERSLDWHADPDRLVRHLETSGFAVERETFVYRHRLPKEVYFRMVRGRYMSLISSFTDRELEEGLAEMAATHAGREVLEFDDRFDVITGIKA
jgi:ubiquinone/menaquinone biosynthesis C-methylase UbiE